MPMAIDVAEMTVQYRDFVKTRFEPLARLWRQANFRHQHNRLSPQAHDLFDGLNIDLRLAASCHAMHKKRFMAVVGERRENRR